MAEYKPEKREAHDSSQCKMCNREPGLAIMLTRYAIAPSEKGMRDVEYYRDYIDNHKYIQGEDCLGGYHTVNARTRIKEAENVTDKNGTAIALDKHTMYTRHFLRNGYVYIYIPEHRPAGTEWQGYYVTDGGFLENMGALNFEKEVDYKNAPPCKPEEVEKCKARFITIPNYKNYTKMWICFSEVKWTKAVLERHKDENYRNRHMRMVKLSELDADKHVWPLTGKNLGKVVGITGDQLSFEFSKAPFVKTMVSDAEKFADKLVQDLTTEKKAYILALEDPAGIAMDLASLMGARQDAFIYQPQYIRAIPSSANIVVFKNAVLEQAMKDYYEKIDKNRKKHKEEKEKYEKKGEINPDPYSDRYTEITVEEYERDLANMASNKTKSRWIKSSPSARESLTSDIAQLTEKANLERGITTKRSLDYARKWAWEPYKFNTRAIWASEDTLIKCDSDGNKMYDFEDGLYYVPKFSKFKNPARVKVLPDELRYDEKGREGIQQRFDKQFAAFKKEIIKPMAEVHAKWMKSESLAEYMTCNFDGEDRESCLTFLDVFTMCIDGSTDKSECIKVYRGWLEDEQWIKEAEKTEKEKLAALTATDRNLLMRAMMLDCKAMLKQLAKEAGEMTREIKAPSAKSAADSALSIGKKFEKKFKIWESLEGAAHKYIETTFELNRNDMASLSLFQMLSESIASFLYESTNPDRLQAHEVKSIPFQLLWGTYNQAPIVMVSVEATETAFAEFMLNRTATLSAQGDQSKKQVNQKDNFVRNRVEALSLDGAIPFVPQRAALLAELKALEEEFDRMGEKPGGIMERDIQLAGKITKIHEKLEEIDKKAKGETKRRQTFFVGVKWQEYTRLKELESMKDLSAVDEKALREFRTQLDNTVIEVPDMKALDFMIDGAWGSVIQSFSSVANFKSLVSGAKGVAKSVEKIAEKASDLDMIRKSRKVYKSLNKFTKRIAVVQSTLGLLESFANVRVAWNAIDKASKTDERIQDALAKYFASITTSLAATAAVIHKGSSLGFFISKYGRAASKKWGKFGKKWGKRLGAPVMAVSALIACEDAYDSYADKNPTLMWMYVGQAVLCIAAIALLFLKAPVVLVVSAFGATVLLEMFIESVENNAHQKWLKGGCFGSKSEGWSHEQESAIFAKACDSAK